MSLKQKFNLVMIASFVAGLGLASAFISVLSRDLARREILSEAATLMDAVSATIHYTEANVVPLLAREMKVQFLPQAIPFFAAQRSFDNFARERPDYSLRQPAENPMNVLDRPEPWERAIIASFQADPKLASSTTERITPSGRVMSFSRPVRVTDGGCLACHSTPQAAPASMVDVYGPRNGFGWALGSTVGAQIVSVPEQVTLARARHSLYVTMAGLGAVFAVMLLVLNLLLQAVIVTPVRRISRSADEISLGNMEVPEFETASKDEIASLATSFNRMRRSLVAAFRLLEE